MASALLVSEQHAECDAMAPPSSTVAAWDETVAQGSGRRSGSLHSSEWSASASSHRTSSPFEYQRNNIYVPCPQATKSLSPERHSPRNAQIALEQIRVLQQKQERRRREEAEAEWIAANRARYAGRWIALLGGDLIAVGDSAKSVAQAAAGASSTPLIIFLDHNLPFAGW